MEKLKRFYELLHELYTIGAIQGTLGWDQQVNMPPKGAKRKAEQLSYLARLRHSKMTSPELFDLTEELGTLQELSDNDRVNIREVKRRLDQHRKLSPEFVTRRQEAVSSTVEIWKEAKSNNDFKSVIPALSDARSISSLGGYLFPS